MLNGSVVLVGVVTGQWKGHEWTWSALLSQGYRKDIHPAFPFVLASLRNLVRRCGFGLRQDSGLPRSPGLVTLKAPCVLSFIKAELRGLSWLHLGTFPPTLLTLGILRKMSH